MRTFNRIIVACLAVAIITLAVVCCLLLGDGSPLALLLASLMVLAGADLFSTVLIHKPLIGPGPLAKSMYPGLENEYNGEE